MSVNKKHIRKNYNTLFQWYFVWFLLITFKVDAQFNDYITPEYRSYYLLPQNTGNHNYRFLITNYFNTKQILSHQAFNTLLINGDYQIKNGTTKISAGGAYLYNHLLSAPITDHQLFFTWAMHKSHRNNIFHVGLQPSIIYRQYTPGSLTYPDQYDRNTGTFNPGLPTQEIAFPYGSKVNYSLNAGIGWTRFFNRFESTLNLTVRDINQPNISLNAHPSKIKINYIVDAHIKHHVTDLFQVNLQAINRWSNRVNVFTFGGYFTHLFNYNNQPLNSVSLGNYWRIRNNKYPNNLIFNLGLHLKKLSIGLAYGYNISSKNKNTASFKTYEITLTYKGIYEYFRQHIIPCKVL